MTAPQPKYRMIPLTQGKFAKVSPRDYDWLMQWKWYARRHPRSGQWYAFRNEYLGNYRSTVLSMAREILGLRLGDGFIADHRNRKQTLNNTRQNLRRATPAQNQHNRSKSKNNTSGLKGAFLTASGRWMSQICVNWKIHYLGLFDTKEEAHAAYCKAAKRLHRQFARAA